MPLLRLETNVQLAEEQQQALLSALSQTVAETIGKPEQYVMVALRPAAMRMSGQPGAAVFAEVRSIGGLNGKVNQVLAQKVCGVLKERLGVSPDRVYLNFTDVSAADWGWNGSTFG